LRLRGTWKKHPLRHHANHPHFDGGPEMVAELVDHYRLKEFVGENQGRKSFSTRAGYESYLNGWILPLWGITGLIAASR
jgi:hypothetical protein